MNSQSAAMAICALASQYRRLDNKQSFDALRQAAWRASGRTTVAQRELAEVFVARPELIDSWISYSEDQRSRDGWYFLQEPTTDRGSRWVVGNLSTDDRLVFSDRVIACALFVAHTVGEPYVQRPGE